jgi:hypothetical protein
MDPLVGSGDPSMESLLIALALAVVISVAVFVQSNSRDPGDEPLGYETSIEALSTEETEDGLEGAMDDAFIVDVASRYNEALVATLDQIDIALLTIVSVDVAFAVFAVDKVFRLTCVLQHVAIYGVAVSMVIGVVGYFSGVFARDGIRPRRLLGDLYERGEDAIGPALSELIKNGEWNRRWRLFKRICAVFAMAAFLCGALSIVVPVLREGAMRADAALPPTACKVVSW